MTDKPSENSNTRITFAVLADVQYCDTEPVGNRHYRNSLSKLTDCIDELSQQPLAFCLNLGDTIERDFDSFKAVLTILTRLPCPVYHLLGNHDYSVDEADRNRIKPLLKLEKAYYKLEYGDWRFICLDGTDVSLYANGPESPQYERAALFLEELKSEEKDNARDWNGAIGRRQTRWLEKQLREAESEEKKIAVFCHFPVYPPDAHNLWNDVETFNIVTASASVKAFISAHHHAGGYVYHKGCHFLKLKGMVEGKTDSAYSVFSFSNSRIVVNGFGSEPDRILEIEKK